MQDFGNIAYLDGYVADGWHAIDPVMQFASPYVGMGNNPVIGVDPDGTSSSCFWCHIKAFFQGNRYTIRQRGAGRQTGTGKGDYDTGFDWSCGFGDYSYYTGGSSGGYSNSTGYNSQNQNPSGSGSSGYDYGIVNSTPENPRSSGWGGGLGAFSDLAHGPSVGEQINDAHNTILNLYEEGRFSHTTYYNAYVPMENIGINGGYEVSFSSQIIKGSDGNWYTKTSATAYAAYAEQVSDKVTYFGNTSLIIDGELVSRNIFSKPTENSTYIITPGHTWLGYSYSALPSSGNVELIITISYTSYIFPNGNAAPLVPFRFIIKLPQ